jgi:hypothetical protein
VSDNNAPQIQQTEMFNAMRQPPAGEPVLKSLSEELDELGKIEGDEAGKLLLAARGALGRQEAVQVRQGQAVQQGRRLIST